MSEKIGIIGGGIAGLTCGIMLKDLGFEVKVFEAAETVRGIGAGMGLAANAMKAFELLHLDQDVARVSHLLQHFQINDAHGKRIFEVATSKIKSSYHQENYTVHRADLHHLLTTKLGSSQIFTGKKLETFSENNKKVRVFFEDDSTEDFDYLIGADGVNSHIRQQLLPTSTPRYAGYWCWRSVVEIPDWKSDQVIETWGKNGRFGITPLTNKRFYWFACKNASLVGKVKDYKIEDLQKNFQTYNAAIREILSKSVDQALISVPIMDIHPITNFHFSRVLLIGDAAHATTPNMGQGACMAIEDVAVLKEALQKHKVLEAFADYNQKRKKRTAYIINTSLLAGKIAQLNTPILMAIRNQLFRILPTSASQLPLKKLLEKDFREDY